MNIPQSEKTAGQWPDFEISIHKLGIEDVSVVAALEQECFALPWSAANYTQALGHEVFFMFGLKACGALVSYISFYHLADEIEIINIATAKAMRRKGYAQKLLAFVQKTASKEKKERILLEVRENNLPAIGLYKALDFVKIGRRKKYYADTGEDALVYEFKPRAFQE